MPTTFIKKKQQKTKPKVETQESNAFDKWYATHGKSFNDKRRERYHADSEYRKKILDAARDSRDRRRGTNTSPPQYVHTMVSAADALGVSIWTLRNWLSNAYFPMPLKYNGELRMTAAQVELLQRIRIYISKNGIIRLSAVQRTELDDIVSGIYAKW